MCNTGGKRVTASLGAHREAVCERATPQDSTIKKGESEQSVSTTFNENTIRQFIRQECMQILLENKVLIPNTIATQKQNDITHDSSKSIGNVNVYYAQENNAMPSTENIQRVVEKLETVLNQTAPEREIQEHNQSHTTPSFSNTLPKKLIQQFESYAEVLQENMKTVNRKVAFKDANREMNIEVCILKGEEEFPVTLLIDTGAQRSFISRSFYEKKLANRIPKKQSFIRMYGVGGNELKTTGEVELDVEIGDEIVRQRFIVAEIKEEGILGFDFCQSHQAEWKWKGKELTLHGETRSRAVHEEKIARVTTRNDVEIPARCEILVSGIVEHSPDAAVVGLVQPQQTFLETHGVGVAATLSKREENSIVVRLINVTEQSVKIKKNTPVAMFSPVTVIEEATVRSTTETWEDENREAENKEKFLHQFDEELSELTEEEQHKFRELLNKYSDQFMSPGNMIGQTGMVQHQIHTGEHPPIKQRPRREPLGMQGAVKEELQKMLDKKIIEPSNSAWASPIVLVKKRDNTIRFCVDYRKLNEVTQKDAYPLPRIEDNLDALRGSKLFSTLDLASGYWQVQMDPAHKHKTAFCTKYGLYQFNVMPFGLCNAPGTFERLMETVLRGMQWERAVLYLDDIIIFSDTVSEHMIRLEEIFQRLQKANLMLKPAKCHFFQRQVEFLGHIVNAEGVSTDPHKIEAIVNWEVPKRVKDVRAFLGITGYYRRFIKDYAQIAKPLHQLTEKSSNFEWTGEVHEAFETLKAALVQAPILGYPSHDEGDRFILDTDASNCHIGGVLSQLQNGQEKVIAYGSKVLSQAERNYCVTRRELLAVVHFCVQFKHYLIGRKFTLRTDHGALTSLFHFKQPEGQIARWLETLSEFDMEIVHRPGRVHSNGDALSRRPCKLSCPTCIKGEKLITDCRQVKEELCNKVTGGRTARRRQQMKEEKNKTTQMSWLLQEQKEDISLQEINTWIQRPEWKEMRGKTAELRNYWSRWTQLKKEDGLWQYKWIDGRQERWKWVIPVKKREEIVKEYHEDKMAGHFSPEKTIDAIKKSPYYMPWLRRTVHDVIDKCDTCEKTKPSTKTLRAPMKTCVAERPMQRVAIDILGPLTTSEQGNKYIIIVADYFTKWTEAYAVPNHKAATVAQKVVCEFFARFGTPEVIHSDQGRDFQSNLFQELCRILEIEKTRTTPWHPQSDGMIERFNRTIETMLRQCVSDHQRDWDEMLPYCCAAYRNAMHSTTKFSPNELMLGRNLPMPAHVQSPLPEKWQNLQEYNSQLIEKMQIAHKLAEENVGKNVMHYKEQYDKKSWQRELKVGTWVWLNNFTKKKGLSPKLQIKWEMKPYQITEFLSEVVVRIKRHGSQVQRIVHINKLKIVGDQEKWAEEVKQGAPRTRTQYKTDDQGYPCVVSRLTRQESTPQNAKRWKNAQGVRRE